jgi:hypothetical protein
LPFAVKISFGVHAFAQLDINALVATATDLRFLRHQLALLKSEAQRLEFLPGQRRLTQAKIARLAGVSDRIVRSWLEKSKTLPFAAVRGPLGLTARGLES